jgi:elongation factor G
LGDDTQTTRAYLPMTEALTHASDLTSMTGGQGMFIMEYDHYEGS